MTWEEMAGLCMTNRFLMIVKNSITSLKFSTYQEIYYKMGESSYSLVITGYGYISHFIDAGLILFTVVALIIVQLTYHPNKHFFSGKIDGCYSVYQL